MTEPERPDPVVGDPAAADPVVGDPVVAGPAAATGRHAQREPGGVAGATRRRGRGVIVAVVAGAVVFVVAANLSLFILPAALRRAGLAAAGVSTTGVSAPTTPPPTAAASGSLGADPSAPAGPVSAGSASAQGHDVEVVCDANPRVAVSVQGVGDGDHLYFSTRSTKPGEPACASADIYVSTYSFRFDPGSGAQLLFGGAGFYVPSTVRGWTPTWSVPASCPGDLYIVEGQLSTITLLQPGVHHPWPTASAANGWQGEIYGYTPTPGPGCSP